jgi:hypothetical protein
MRSKRLWYDVFRRNRIERQIWIWIGRSEHVSKDVIEWRYAVAVGRGTFSEILHGPRVLTFCGTSFQSWDILKSDVQ